MTVTVESHPFQVGRMVYATMEEATAKAELAQSEYPSVKVVVIDRREMIQVWPSWMDR